jgi:hypothetical protein
VELCTVLYYSSGVVARLQQSLLFITLSVRVGTIVLCVWCGVDDDEGVLFVVCSYHRYPVIVDSSIMHVLVPVP